MSERLPSTEAPPSNEALMHWEGLSVAAWRERWGVPALEIHARIGSTNDRALVLAVAGAAPFTLVLAEEQTAGRGRRGAAWHSPSGAGLWMSAVLPAAAQAAHLPLLVGLAVAEAVEGVAAGLRGGEGGPPRLGIKWPNDLVLGGRKVGGVLCESASGAMVAGIGLNVRGPAGGLPETLRDVATSLEEQGIKSLSRSDLAGAIVRSIEARCAPAGPVAAPLAGPLADEALAALRARDVLAGRPVRTEEQGPGTAVGLDRDGALILERAGGSRVRVVSGSVRPE